MRGPIWPFLWPLSGAGSRRSGALSPVLALLLAMAAAIGLGSFLFHTFANVWSKLADVVPIWSFVAAYVLVSIHVVGGFPPGRLVRIAAIATAVVVLVSFATTPGGNATAPVTGNVLNGSGQYAPALAALVVFSMVTGIRRRPVRHWVSAATLAFLASLTFRTLDMHLCSTFAHGPLFLWHILNGAMAALLLQALIRAPRHRQSVSG